MDVVELRRYVLHPGQRDVLIALFDREFIEPQEALGMTVVGQLRDLDEPDRFVWFRGFTDMAARARGLAAFYGGPTWKAHREAANATMIDSDDVLLLRPAHPTVAFALGGRRRPGPDAPVPASVGDLAPMLVVVAEYFVDRGPSPELVAAFERDAAPALVAAGATIRAVLVTEPAANTFPALPVRERVHVLVAVTTVEPAGADEVVRIARLTAWAGATDPIHAVEVLRLAPTSRSLLGGDAR